MKKLYTVFVLVLTLASTLTSAQTLIPEFLYPNGPVHAIVKTGNTVYVGGDFDFVGPNTPYGIATDYWFATPRPNQAAPNDAVRIAISDQNGGWFIGGEFTQVGGQPRTMVAHLNADGSLDSWNVTIAGGTMVTSLAFSQATQTLYIGGDFTTVNGQSRNYLAAVNTTTGALLPWNPSPDAMVSTLAYANNLVYAGGYFNTIGGQTRPRLAELGAVTGLATTWNPNVTGTYVSNVWLSGNDLYVGGSFSSVGGQARNNIAYVDLGSHSVTGWNPNANAPVMDITVENGTVYIGGVFTAVGGQARNHLAAISAGTGTVTAWNPSPNGSAVWALTRVNGGIYVGGDFTTIAGQPRNRVAAFDDYTGNLRDWDADANGTVYELTLSGNTIYIGGDFTTINGGGPRNNIAAFDVNTGKLTSWNPSVSGPVHALALNGGEIVVGGSFTAINATPRANVGAINLATGATTAWNPGVTGSVHTILVNGTTVYIGGQFISAGGQTRNNIAALDVSGAATAWNPNANGMVRALATNAGVIYAGGDFTTIGGQTRNRIAALNASTGTATAWNPNANAPVHELIANATTVYAGGSFSTIGGQTRNAIAALSPATGAATAWNPNITDWFQNGPGTVMAMALDVNTMYVGGQFYWNGNERRTHLGSIEIPSGIATPWIADAGGDPLTTGIHAIATDFNMVYVGGDFTNIQFHDNDYFAVFEKQEESPVPLPVNWLTFTARPQQTGANWQVALNWSTASEENNARFIIERSKDGRIYEKVGEVTGTGNTTSVSAYSFMDKSPLMGTSFYRLKQVDIDGNFHYSKIALANISGSDIVVVMYPNPVRDAASLLINSATKQPLRFSVFDLAGREVKTGTYNIQKGDNNFGFSVQELKSGTYTLQVTSNTGKQQVRFIKQ